MTPECLPTPAEMAQADASCGILIETLIARAAQAVVRAARAFGPRRTLVLCGPGNNGADGWAAARLLHHMGWPVAVAHLGPARPTPCPIVPFAPADARRAGLVIDAVFGAGLRAPVADAVSDTLAAATCVLAVDVPSGLDGATGQALGRVRAAERTVTFVRRKPGHVLLPGRALCGETVLADIGMPARVFAGVRTWRNTPALWSVPVPGAAGHKYTRGHVTVLGGAMPGAARLAASGARRAGAGLVTIASATPHAYDAAAAGIIVSGAPLPELLADARRVAWVCGPGLGVEAARAAVPLLRGRLVVADADALTAFAGKPEGLSTCAVLTPHEGEFGRVFGPVGPDKLAATRAAAARLGTVVVLKGADTVIAAPDGRAAINDNAPPWLATAGAGDVLAGTIAGLLAQGMPAWEAACAGVWLHGRAAALAGPGLIAEDLPQKIAQACAELWTTGR